MRSTDRANPYKLISSGCRPRVGVWPSWLKKNGQRICIHRVRCLGGWGETHTCVIPISVFCCVALLPVKSMVPPYSASRHRLRHPVMFVFFFMVIVIILRLNICLPSGLLCRPCPTSWTLKSLLGFSRSVPLPFFFFFWTCLPSGRVMPSFFWSFP